MTPPEFLTLLEKADSTRTAHLFGQSGGVTWEPEEAYAFSLVRQLQLRSAQGSMADYARLAELIVAAYSLDAGPQNLKAVGPAETAAGLYASGGFTARARALRRQFGSVTGRSTATPGRERDQLQSLARDSYVAISSRNVSVLPDLAQRLRDLSETDSLEVDQRRCASLLAMVLAELSEFVSAVAPIGSDGRSMTSKLALLEYIAAECADYELLHVAKNISETTKILMDRSASQILTQPGFRFPAGYLRTLFQDDEGKSVVELWPSQIAAIDAGAVNLSGFVLSLPTSAGKTLIAELKIMDFLSRNSGALAVYVAPYIALASQVRATLERRLLAAGFNPPQIWTGTFEIDNFAMPDANLLITTPEKLDSILRNRLEGDTRSLEVFRRLGLVVIDEVHMIGSKGRGLSLELFISRLLKLKPQIDVLAMSAVIENVGDLAQWICGRRSSLAQSDWRPTERRTFYLRRNGAVFELPGLTDTGLRLEPWKSAKDAIARLVCQFAAGGVSPVLVVETQRRYAESAAEAIFKKLSPETEVSRECFAAREMAAVQARRLLGSSHLLGKYVSTGVAYHHAGLPQDVSTSIEELARRGYLRAVCSTTTLAEGIDLPFRSVIIPHVYLADQQLMSTALLQNVIGRAGRADVSITGTAVVLEAGTAVSAYAESALLKNIGRRHAVRSNLSALKTDPKSHEDWDHYLRLQAQLMGLLLDETLEDEQASEFSKACFAAIAGQVRPQALQGAFTSILDQMLTADPPMATRASPYRLTEYGKVAGIGGLSASSNRLLLRELGAEIRNKGTWFTREAWLDRHLTVELTKRLSELVHVPLEALTLCLDRWERNFNSITRDWMHGDQASWKNALGPSITLLTGWVAGDELNDIAAAHNAARAALHRGTGRTTKLAGSDVLELINQRIVAYLWYCSAAIRLSEHLVRQDKRTEIPFRRILAYLEHGTTNSDALQLMILGCDRSLAHRLIPLVREFDQSDQDRFRFSLLSLRDRALSDAGLSDEMVALYSDFRNRLRNVGAN